MKEDHKHRPCSRCGRKLTIKEWLVNQGRGFVTFLCALCLAFAVGTSEWSFTKVAEQDQAINAFSTNAVQFMFASSASTAAPSGDRMIDFAYIHRVEIQTPFQIQKKNTRIC